MNCSFDKWIYGVSDVSFPSFSYFSFCCCCKLLHWIWRQFWIIISIFYWKCRCDNKILSHFTCIPYMNINHTMNTPRLNCLLFIDCCGFNRARTITNHFEQYYHLNMFVNIHWACQIIILLIFYLLIFINNRDMLWEDCLSTLYTTQIG